MVSLVQSYRFYISFWYWYICFQFCIETNILRIFFLSIGFQVTSIRWFAVFHCGLLCYSFWCCYVKKLLYILYVWFVIYTVYVMSNFYHFYNFLFYFPYIREVQESKKNHPPRFIQNFMFQTIQIPKNKVFHFRQSVCLLAL